MGSEDRTEVGYSSPFQGISLIDWMLVTVEVQSVRGELWSLDPLAWQSWLGLPSSSSARVNSSQTSHISITWEAFKTHHAGSYSRSIKSQCLGVGTASVIFFKDFQMILTYSSVGSTIMGVVDSTPGVRQLHCPSPTYLIRRICKPPFALLAFQMPLLTPLPFMLLLRYSSHRLVCARSSSSS